MRHSTEELSFPECGATTVGRHTCQTQKDMATPYQFRKDCLMQPTINSRGQIQLHHKPGSTGASWNFHCQEAGTGGHCTQQCFWRRASTCPSSWESPGFCGGFLGSFLFQSHSQGKFLLFASLNSSWAVDALETGFFWLKESPVSLCLFLWRS